MTETLFYLGVFYLVGASIAGAASTVLKDAEWRSRLLWCACSMLGWGTFDLILGIGRLS